MSADESLTTLPKGGPGRFWRGDERLWKAFWLMGVVGGWAILVVVAVMVQLLGGPPRAGIVLLLIYMIWVAVVVWRCAFNVQWRFWGYLARGTMVLLLGMLALGAAEIALTQFGVI